MKQLEYVASATNHMNLGGTFYYKGELFPMVEEFKRIFRTISGDSKNHNFSLLYNAYTEAAYGERFRNFGDSIHSIHADSGGLQIVTQGMTITQELKKKVYENQAQFAHVGMSFDEIPVTLTSTRSQRNDINNRYFDISKFHGCAVLSGQNLNDQINYFRSVDSKCRPYMIAQGNCLETYLEWTEIMLEQLEGDNINYIGGCAVGAAALGGGALEDVKKSFYYSEIAKMLPNRHFHILGVGSITRLLPSLIMLKNGMFDSPTEEAYMSYDSSTHTMIINFGGFLGKNAVYNPLKVKKDYEALHSEVLSTFPFYDISAEELFKFIRVPPSTLSCLNEKFVSIKARYLTPLSSIYNFVQTVDNIFEDVTRGLDYVSKSDYYPMQELIKVKSKEDYIEWEKMYGNSLQSKAYPTKKPNTLF